MPAEIRVIVADRRRSVAELLALGLGQLGVSAIAVCGLEEACRSAAERRTDAVVADASLLASLGLPLAQSPWFHRLRLPLVVLSDGSRTDDLACAAVRAGVRGWVHKDSSLRHLLTVIEGVLHGETWIPPALLTRIIAELLLVRDDLDAGTERMASLTRREREVLECLSAGMNREEIAERLFLSTNTVRTHVQNLMAKLGVHSSVAAVAVAHRLGMPLPAPGAEPGQQAPRSGTRPAPE
jgi:DNA-binding NarL/FixJ family response regulator